MSMVALSTAIPLWDEPAYATAPLQWTTGYVIDAANEKAGLVMEATKAGNISKVGFYLSVHTTGATSASGTGGFRAGGNTTDLQSAGSSTGVAAAVLGSLRFAKALSFTIPAGFETAITAAAASNPAPTDNPIYAYDDNYTYP